MKQWLMVMLIVLTGCTEKEVLVTGKTMGTTYHIKAITAKSEKELKQRIDKRLEEINKSMSTFLKDSEISKFNELKDVKKRYYISDDFFEVMIVSKNLYQLTNGAWDGTVNPLVNLWGFGSKSGTERKIPTPDEIQKILPTIGFDKIEVSEERYLQKKQPEITLDLASIAKGFGVDQIAELLEKNGIKNFLVEIGGEVFASGSKLDGTPWRVGINYPSKDAALDQVYKTVELQNKALATSGDYRIFFEADGRQYSHIIDPKTGYTVSNGVVSASVMADNCTFADGLATALMVMGPEKGIELVNRLNNVECLIIVQEPDRTLKDYYSKGLKTD